MSVLSKGLIVASLCFAAALVGAGCSPDDAELTKTERMRQTLDPKVKNFLALGQQAVQEGAYGYALAMADSAERYAPELADVPFLRGTVYTLMNRFDAAQEAYEQVIALDPAYPGARLSMGDNAFEQGHHREALRLYRDEEAVAPTASVYVEMGRAYAELGVVDSARMAYEQAIALDSTDARTHMLYGQLLEQAGDLETALAHSRKALALRPDQANYRFIVGAQLFRSGQLEEAVDYLRPVADTSPLHYPAQYNLAQALARLGRQEEADRYFAQADSTQELLHQITLAEDEATRNPDAAEPWTKLGELLHTAEIYDRAAEAFNLAATADPSNLAAQHGLAKVAMASGNTGEALQRLQAIVNADPTHVDAWLTLGLAHALTGNCTEAKRAWETALQHRPGDPMAQHYLTGLCQYTAP